MIYSKLYGYARVSTRNQNVQRQLNALIDYGINEADIFIDYASGSNFDRPNYQLLKDTVREGDTIVFTDLSRFGRNEKKVKEEYKNFKNQGVHLEFIGIDYDKYNNTDEYVNSMSSFYEMENKEIKIRQLEGFKNMPINENGRKYSLKTGRECGRPRIEDSDNLNEYIEAYLNNEMTVNEMLEETGMKQTTIYERIKEYKKKNNCKKKKKKKNDNKKKKKNCKKNKHKHDFNNDGILYILIF